jgi:hypothetical protein
MFRSKFELPQNVTFTQENREFILTFCNQAHSYGARGQPYGMPGAAAATARQKCEFPQRTVKMTE